MAGDPRFLIAGDSALVVEFGNTIDPATNRRVRELLLSIERAGVEGVRDLVPSYRSRPVPPPRVVEIPTAYGGVFGPDLAFVAGHNGLTEDEVVAIHAGTDYLVYMMGFSPGFTYLGGMSERIAAPRLETPRTAIPAGSVGIAQQQTGIYPVESPGGWRLIGRTPVTLFDPSRNPPVIVDAGDYIRFVPVAPDDYPAIRERIRQGTWTLQVRDVTT
jgi:inhibitor of KinA